MGLNSISLQDALSSFTDGVKALSTQRALMNANDQVNQIKSTEQDQAVQRQKLGQVAQNLTMQMSGMGVDPATINTAAGAIKPPTFADADDMYKNAVLNNDQKGMAQAQQVGTFEHQWDKDDDDGTKSANLALKQQAATEHTNEFVTRQLGTVGDDIDMAKASSRTAYGKWAAMEGNGERVRGLLGSPESWKAMTGKNLGLANDMVGTMSKGSALTTEDQKVVNDISAKIAYAQFREKTDNKPYPIDLSGYAGQISNLVQKEDQTAKSNLLDQVMYKINKKANIAKLSPDASDQYKLTVAKGLGQIGISVDPDKIQVDPKHGVIIPGVTDVLQHADDIKKEVQQNYKTINDPKADPAKKAAIIKSMGRYGVTPNTPYPEALQVIQRAVKAKAFE